MTKFLPIIGIVLGVAMCVTYWAEGNFNAAAWAGISAIWAVNVLVKEL